MPIKKFNSGATPKKVAPVKASSARKPKPVNVDPAKAKKLVEAIHAHFWADTGAPIFWVNFYELAEKHGVRLDPPPIGMSDG
jgi:hypothetical protein